MSVTLAEDNEWRVHVIVVHFQSLGLLQTSLGLKISVIYIMHLLLMNFEMYRRIMTCSN